MVSWFPMRKIKCLSFLFLFFQFHELIHDFSSISCWNEMEKKQGSSRNYYFLFYIFILNLILFFLSFWIFFNFYVIVFSVLGFYFDYYSFSATFITFFIICLIFSFVFLKIHTAFFIVVFCYFWVLFLIIIVSLQIFYFFLHTRILSSTKLKNGNYSFKV